MRAVLKASSVSRNGRIASIYLFFDDLPHSH
jgi:hypothetical protein